MRLFLGILLALIAASAQAQVDPGDYDRFQTRYGLVEVTGPEFQRTIAVNGQVLPLEPNYSFNIHGAWGLADADHDWVFVQSHHGGNMCGPGLTVLRVSEAAIEVLGSLGDCSGFPFETRIYPGAIELDVYNSGLRVDYTTYRFGDDGAAQTLHPGQFGDPIPAGPNADALRWVGEHPYGIFRDPSERARFLTIMSEDDIRELAVRFGPANAVVQRGNWVLGAGCMAHACNVAGGIWGIRISDGAPAAAIIDAGNPVQPYGPAAADPVFAGWMNEHR